MSMPEKEFRELVRAMRATQCRYFRTRDKRVLADSKALEQRVDNELAGRGDEAPQPELFGAT